MYELKTPAGPVRLVDLHLATARHALTEIIRGGLANGPEIMENAALRAEQSESAYHFVPRGGTPVLVAGDFNTLTDSSMFRRYWSRFTNTFSTAGLGYGFTHFTHRTALRIDHVLTGPGWYVSRAWVGPNVGSAHRPVLADVEWQGGAD